MKGHVCHPTPPLLIELYFPNPPALGNFHCKKGGGYYPAHHWGEFKRGEAPLFLIPPSFGKGRGTGGWISLIKSGRFGGTQSLHLNLSPSPCKERGIKGVRLL